MTQLSPGNSLCPSITSVELTYTQGQRRQQQDPKHQEQVNLAPSARRLLPDSLFSAPFPGNDVLTADTRVSCREVFGSSHSLHVLGCCQQCLVLLRLCFKPEKLCFTKPQNRPCRFSCRRRLLIEAEKGCTQQKAAKQQISVAQAHAQIGL